MAADRPDGMQKTELEILKSFITLNRVTNVLEIGLANASSSIAILEAINDISTSSLTSIDPYQNYPLVKDTDGISGYAGLGLQRIKDSNFSAQHIFIEETNYIALPQLVKMEKKYDMILIDGYHSFDFTMLDFFYSDLLLNDHGLLVIHDSNLKSVYAVCKYIEANKPYINLGPKIECNLNSIYERIVRRIKYLLSGNYNEFRLRKDYWRSLAIFRKNESKISSETQLASVMFTD